MLRVKTLAVVCCLSLGSIALAAAPPPTTPPIAPAAQVADSPVKMLIASEEASATIEALAVAKSVVVQASPPPLKGAAPPKVLTAELVFETSKEKGDVRKQVERLQGLVVVDGAKRRPPLVRVVWNGGLPPFEGVIVSLYAKYTLFMEGAPTRATVNVSMREGMRCMRDAHCSSGLVCLAGRCATPMPTPLPPSSAPTRPF